MQLCDFQLRQTVGRRDVSSWPPTPPHPRGQSGPAPRRAQHRPPAQLPPADRFQEGRGSCKGVTGGKGDRKLATRNHRRDAPKQPWEHRQSAGQRAPAPRGTNHSEMRPHMLAHFTRPRDQPGRLPVHSQGTVHVVAIHCQTGKGLPGNNGRFTFYA